MSLTEQLIAAKLTAHAVQIDGTEELVVHGDQEASARALEVFVDWLDQRAHLLRMTVGPGEMARQAAIRVAAVLALEAARDEIRAEVNQ